MGRVESKRFDLDPDTGGMWDQVKGDLHRRLGQDLSNGAALRWVARVYLDAAQRDPQGVSRVIDRLRLGDGGYRV